MVNPANIFTFLLLLTSSIRAWPIPADSDAPIVELEDVIWQGFRTADQENWLGIPFAVPPVGDRRLRPSSVLYGAPHNRHEETSYNYFNRTILGTDQWTNKVVYNATKYSPGCIQTQFVPSADIPSPLDQSEDCLSLNIQKPSGEGIHDGLLPVLLWIYGGAFQSGTASNNASDGTFLVQKSVKIGHPVLYVSINYRNGPLGFLGGSEIASSGNQNLGLRDQATALQWLKRNIAAFGGDPNRITVFGESGGAVSIGYHLLAQGTGFEMPSFRGAILQSGTAATGYSLGDIEGTQPVYDFVVAGVNCSSAADTLECLRQVPFTAYVQVAAAAVKRFTVPPFITAFRPLSQVPGLPDYPSELEQQGSFPDIPVLIGNARDEGTLWAGLPQYPGITNGSALFDVVKSADSRLPDSVVEKILSFYPDDPADGAPYGLNGSVIGPSPEFRRLAAIGGDYGFISDIRSFQNALLQYKTTPTWGYIFSQCNSADPSYICSAHGTDVPYVFGIPARNKSRPLGERSTSKLMTTAWLSFVATGDPNTNGVPYWPTYG